LANDRIVTCVGQLGGSTLLGGCRCASGGTPDPVSPGTARPGPGSRWSARRPPDALGPSQLASAGGRGRSWPSDHHHCVEFIA